MTNLVPTFTDSARALRRESMVDTLRKLTLILSRDHGIKVVFRGSEAKTDGRTVIVPSLPDSAPDELVRAVIGFIDHEVGHLLFTDMKFKKSFRDPDKRVKIVTNFIEDCRIERLMGIEYRGAGLNLDFVQGWIFDRYRGKWDQVSPFMRLLMMCLVRAKLEYGNPDVHLPIYKEFAGADVAPVVDAMLPLVRSWPTLRSTAESYKAAKEFLLQLDAMRPPEPPPADEDDEGEQEAGQQQGRGDQQGKSGQQSQGDEQSQQQQGDQGDDQQQSGDGKSKKEGKSDEAEAGDSAAGESQDQDKGDDASGQEEADDHGDEDGQAGDKEGAPAGDEEGAGEDDADGDGGTEAGDEADAGGDENGAEGDSAGDGNEGDAASGDADGSGEDGAADSEAGDDVGDGAGSGEGEGDGDDQDQEQAGGGAAEEAAGDEDKGGDEGGGGTSSGDEGSADSTADGNADGGDAGDTQADADDASGTADGADEEMTAGHAVKEKVSAILDSYSDDPDNENGLQGKIAVAIGGDAAQVGGFRPFTTELDLVVPPQGTPTIEGYNKLYEPVRQATAVIAGVMRRSLQTQTKARVLRARHTGTIDLANLAKIRVKSPDVFKKRKDGLEIDTCVQLIIDSSGSMNGEKMMTAAGTAIAISEALSLINIPFAVSSFTAGSGFRYHADIDKQRDLDQRTKAVKTSLEALGFSHRWYPGPQLSAYHRIDPTVEYVFKTFDENYRFMKTRMSLMTEQFMGCNADGDSIWEITKRVVRRRDRRKVIIVVSDGLPSYATGWQGAPAAHLTHVIKTIESIPDVEIVGIGICSDAVKDFYKRSFMINSASELGPAAMKELKDILLN